MARMVISSGMIAAFSTSAYGGAWNAAGQASVGGNYDDNIRLSNTQPLGAWNAQADISGQLAYQDNAFLWQLSPRLLTVRYDGLTLINRNEQYLTTLLKKVTETGSISLTVAGVQDTTLTSELGLTGLADVNRKHRSGTVTLDSGRNLTERVGINAQLYASINRYVDAQRTGLVDYNYGSLALSSSYDWTAQSSFILQVSAGKLQVPDIAAYDKLNVSAALAYHLQFSPRLHAQLSYGPSQIRTHGRADTGSVYDASLVHDSELDSLRLTLSRDVIPNGLGLLSRREQIQLNVTHSLSERWLVDGSVAAIRNQNVLATGVIADDTVTYADVSGNLRWRMTPTWTLNMAAGYSRQSESGIPGAAERRHASLGIAWNGLTQSLH